MSLINDFDPVEGSFLDVKENQLVISRADKYQKTEKGRVPAWQEDSFSRVMAYLHDNPVAFEGVSAEKLESFAKFIHDFDPSQKLRIRKIERIMFNRLISQEAPHVNVSENFLNIMLDSLKLQNFSIQELTRLAKVFNHVADDQTNSLKKQLIILNGISSLNARSLIYRLLEESPPINPEGKFSYRIHLFEGKDDREIEELLKTILKSPSPERGDVINSKELLSGINYYIYNNEKRIFNILAAIPQGERTDVIDQAKKFIVPHMNGQEIATILEYIIEIPLIERPDFINQSKELIQAHMKSDEIVKIIMALSKIAPYSERADVIKQTKELILAHMNGSAIVKIIMGLAKIPSHDERVDVIEQTKKLTTPNSHSIASILSSLAKFPSRLERTEFIHQSKELIKADMDDFTISIILDSLAKISSHDERVDVISQFKNLINIDMPAEDIATILDSLSKIPLYKRGDVVKQSKKLIRVNMDSHGIAMILTLKADQEDPQFKVSDNFLNIILDFLNLKNFSTQELTRLAKIFNNVADDQTSSLKEQLLLLNGILSPNTRSLIFRLLEESPPIGSEGKFSYGLHLFEGRDDIELEELLTSILELPLPERGDVINQSKELITPNMQSGEITTILRYIAKRPFLERADFINQSKQLIKDHMNGSEIVNIIVGLANIFDIIPINERAEVISAALPLIRDTTSLDVRSSILVCILSLLPKERKEIIDRAVKLVENREEVIPIAIFICSIFPEEALQKISPDIVKKTLSGNKQDFLQFFSEPSALDRLFTRLDTLMPYEVQLKTSLYDIKQVVQSLGLNEEHPLYQKVIECGILLGENKGPKHPYSIYQNALTGQSEQKELLKDYTTVYFDPSSSAINKIKPPEIPVSFKDLPKIHFEEIEAISVQLKEKWENATDEEKDKMNSNFNYSMENILSSPLNAQKDFIAFMNQAKDLQEMSNPDEICPNSLYQFLTLIKALISESQELGPSGLTKKEELFLKLSEEFSLPPLKLPMAKFREMKETILYKDLPKVSFDQLKKVHDDLELKYQALSSEDKVKMDKAVEEQFGEGTTLLNILKNTQLIHDKRILQWMESKGEPDAPCPTHIFKLRYLVDQLMKESDETGPSGLSKKEELLLKWSDSIRHCSTGMQSAIDLIYSTYQLQGSKTLPENEALAKMTQTISQEWMLSFFTDLDFLEEAASNSSAISQGSHISLYLMNRLNIIAGLNHLVRFDPHTWALDDELVEKDTATLAALFLKQLNPQKLIEKTRNYFNLALRDLDLKVFQKLSRHFKNNPIPFEALVLDSEGNPYLTTQGALALLIHQGYLQRAE